MSKVTFKPGTMLNPVPVVMVSCGSTEADYNIITVAWTGIVNSEPPMTYISVRKSRHSHAIIEKTGEFVINLCTEALAFQTDYCGVKSGREINKFAEQKLTPVPGEQVSCPMIQEAPVNLECRVREVHEYPSHDMFVADILAVHADESLFHENGKLELERAGLICYSHGEYFGLQKKPLGKFGYSIMKPKTKKRIAAEERKNRIASDERKKKNTTEERKKPSSQKGSGGKKQGTQASFPKKDAKPWQGKTETKPQRQSSNKGSVSGKGSTPVNSGKQKG